MHQPSRPLRTLPARFVAAAVAACPITVLAHPAAEHVIGFMQGIAHPFGGIDHLLAMVAVGLLGARLGGRARWLIPASFMTLMAVGTCLGMAGVSLPLVETGIAASIVVFGLLLASGRDMTVPSTMIVVGFFALFHGHAHGSEAAPDVAGIGYEFGLLLATGVLHASGVLAAMLLMRWNRAAATPVLRWSGSLVALGGLGVLAGWI